MAAQFRKTNGISHNVAELHFKNIGCQHFHDDAHLAGNDIKQLGRRCFHWSFSNRIAQAAACSRERIQ